MDLKNVCRLCLVENVALVWVFDPGFEGNTYMRDLIFKTTGIKISEEDSISQKICRQCGDDVIKFYEFRNKSVKNDEYLKGQEKQLSYKKTPHSSILELYKNYPRIQLPNLEICLAENISPVVEMQMNEVENYFKSRKYDFQKHVQQVLKQERQQKRTKFLLFKSKICTPKETVSPISIKFRQDKSSYEIVNKKYKSVEELMQHDFTKESRRKRQLSDSEKMDTSKKACMEDNSGTKQLVEPLHSNSTLENSDLHKSLLDALEKSESNSPKFLLNSPSGRAPQILSNIILRPAEHNLPPTRTSLPKIPDNQQLSLDIPVHLGITPLNSSLQNLSPDLSTSKLPESPKREVQIIQVDEFLNPIKIVNPQNLNQELITSKPSEYTTTETKVIQVYESLNSNRIVKLQPEIDKENISNKLSSDYVVPNMNITSQNLSPTGYFHHKPLKSLKRIPDFLKSDETKMSVQNTSSLCSSSYKSSNSYKNVITAIEEVISRCQLETSKENCSVPKKNVDHHMPTYLDFPEHKNTPQNPSLCRFPKSRQKICQDDKLSNFHLETSKILKDELSTPGVVPSLVITPGSASTTTPSSSKSLNFKEVPEVTQLEICKENDSLLQNYTDKPSTDIDISELKMKPPDLCSTTCLYMPPASVKMIPEIPEGGETCIEKYPISHSSISLDIPKLKTIPHVHLSPTVSSSCKSPKSYTKVTESIEEDSQSESNKEKSQIPNKVALIDMEISNTETPQDSSSNTVAEIVSVDSIGILSKNLDSIDPNREYTEQEDRNVYEEVVCKYCRETFTSKDLHLENCFVRKALIPSYVLVEKLDDQDIKNIYSHGHFEKPETKPLSTKFPTLNPQIILKNNKYPDINYSSSVVDIIKQLLLYEQHNVHTDQNLQTDLTSENPQLHEILSEIKKIPKTDYIFPQSNGTILMNYLKSYIDLYKVPIDIRYGQSVQVQYDLEEPSKPIKVFKNWGDLTPIDVYSPTSDITKKPQHIPNVEPLVTEISKSVDDILETEMEVRKILHSISVASKPELSSKEKNTLLEPTIHNKTVDPISLSLDEKIKQLRFWNTQINKVPLSNKSLEDELPDLSGSLDDLFEYDNQSTANEAQKNVMQQNGVQFTQQNYFSRMIVNLQSNQDMYSNLNQPMNSTLSDNCRFYHPQNPPVFSTVDNPEPQFIRNIPPAYRSIRPPPPPYPRQPKISVPNSSTRNFLDCQFVNYSSLANDNLKHMNYAKANQTDNYTVPMNTVHNVSSIRVRPLRDLK